MNAIRLIPDFLFYNGLQILYLQAICKGYLQACISLHSNGVSPKSLQMADKMRKKTLCRLAPKSDSINSTFTFAYTFQIPWYI